jgi:hypothetical protein
VREGAGLAKGSATSAYTVTSDGELFYATTDSATYGNCGPVTMHHQSAGRDVATWNPLVGSEAQAATTVGYTLRGVTASQDRVGWYGAPCTDPEDGTNYGLLHIAATDGSHRIDVSPGEHFVSSMALSDDGRLAVAVAIGQSQQTRATGWFVSVSAAPTASGTLRMQPTMHADDNCSIVDLRWHGADLVLLQSCPQADTVTSRVSVLVYTGPAFAARTVARLGDTKLGAAQLLQPSDGSIVVRESSTDVLDPQPDVYAVLADAAHVRRFTAAR